MAERQPPSDDRADTFAIARAFDGSHVRLGTLVAIRWLAVIGQLVTLLVVRYGLGFDLALFWPCLTVAVSALLNLALSLRYPSSLHLSDRGAALQLAFDLLQLVLLLSLTGGLTNPFALLILVPVTISATVLSRKSTVILLVLALASSLALALWHLPLPWKGVPLDIPGIYMFGLWTGLAFSMTFLALYAARVSADARRRAKALAATQAALEREHKLAELGTLAAAAAHELGTPLGTITLAANELLNQTAKDDPRHDDVALIHSQIRRCHKILEQLSSKDLGDEPHPFPKPTVEALVREACRAFEGLTDIAIDITTRPPTPGEATLHQPVVARRAEVLHALTNFIENAIGFADSQVRVTIAWSNTVVRVSIDDDGPGFDPTIQKRLGEPYVTSRHALLLEGAPKGDMHADTGLGLGVFIAKTLLERTKAHLKFVNRTNKGASVQIRWNRADLEKGD